MGRRGLGRKHAATVSILVVLLAVGAAAPSAIGVVPTTPATATTARHAAPSVVTPDVSGNYQPFTGDFDGNGYSDVFWYAPGPAPDYIWYFTGRNRHTQRPVTVNGNYTPVVADFNADRPDDILWYAPGPAPDFLWSGRADHTFATRPYVAGGNFRPVAGDFNGDGFPDILWYAPGTAPDYLWTGTGGGRFAWTGIKLDGDYTPYVGDFDGNQRTDLLLHSIDGGASAIAFSAYSGKFSFHTIQAPAATIPVVGDFNGYRDRRADILWYGSGDVADEAWYSTDRSLGFTHSVGAINGAGYVPLAGDFDGNRVADIFWYAPGSAPERIWYDVTADFQSGAVPRWVRDLGTVNDDAASAVAVSNRDTVAVAGSQNQAIQDIATARPRERNLRSTSPANGVPNADVFVAAFDTRGHELWRQLLATGADDYALAIAFDLDGNVYVTGSTQGVLPGAPEHVPGMFVAKLDGAGHVLWVHQHTGLYEGKGIAIDPAGNVFVSTSHAVPHNSEIDSYVVKYDTSGHESWLVRDASVSPGYCNGSNHLAVDVAGSVYLSGVAPHLVPDDVGIVVAKYGSDGHRMWRQRIGDLGTGPACGIGVDLAGSAYVTGDAYDKVPGAPEAFGGGADVLLVKITTDGAIAWVHTLGGQRYDKGTGLAVDGAGDMWITGTAGPLPGSAEGSTDQDKVFLAKYSTDGVRLAVHEFGGDTMYALSAGVAVDSRSRAYLAGASNRPWPSSNDPFLGGDFDAFVLQY